MTSAALQSHLCSGTTLNIFGSRTENACVEGRGGMWNTYCLGLGRPGHPGRDRPESLYWSQSPSPPERGVREWRRRERRRTEIEDNE